MAQTILSNSLDSRIVLIEQAVAAIAQNADEDNLQDLRQLLIGLAGILERDPGIEMASDDLYAAARAYVEDSCLGERPLARKQRLLLGASGRLVARLREASAQLCVAEEAPSIVEPATLGPAALAWRPGEWSPVGPRPLCAPAH